MPAYRRRRASSARGSNLQSSSRGQSSRFRTSSSRSSSVLQDEHRSSSMHPPLRNRISIRSASSHVAAPPSVQTQNSDVGIEENESDIQEREDQDSMNEIVMAVELKERGTIGCAYYIAREEKLCVMADISIAGLDIIDTLKIHIEPTGRFRNRAYMLSMLITL